MTDCTSPNRQSTPPFKCLNHNDKQPAASKHAMSIIVVILGSFRIPATSMLASLLLVVHCPFYPALLTPSWARCTRPGRSRRNTRVGLVLVTVCSVQWRPWRFPRSFIACSASLPRRNGFLDAFPSKAPADYVVPKEHWISIGDGHPETQVKYDRAFRASPDDEGHVDGCRPGLFCPLLQRVDEGADTGNRHWMSRHMVRSLRRECKRGR